MNLPDVQRGVELFQTSTDSENRYHRKDAFMFWKYNNSSLTEIEILLQRQDVTLQEVMDSEDIINECRIHKKPLIDFLLKPEIIEELVNLTVSEPQTELDENVRFKYPTIACELLTSDVPAINERLASDEILLDKLYRFLESDPPLNPLLASYFSKIMGALITKKAEQNWLSYQFTCLQVLQYLKDKDTFISLLLKHLGTSAIMDLMLKLVTQVESLEMRQNILNWLDSQELMQSLVALMNPKIDKEIHYNVAQLLCDFIVTARDTLRNTIERNDPDPLLNTLESPETVSLLLSHMFDGEKSESAIVGGIRVLLALLDVNHSCIPKTNSNINDEAIDIEHKQKVVKTTTESIAKHLQDFHNLLLDPPKKNSINTTIGVLDPPLGNTRLQVVNLFAAFISSSNIDLLEDMISLETIPVLLNLFFKYPWNNFLHTHVENCLVNALEVHISKDVDVEQKTNALRSHLLVNCKLIETILDAWKDNDEKEKKSNHVRQGYMGHLINIVNKIVNLCSNTALGQYIEANLPEVSKTLEDFKINILEPTNTIRDSLLGGVYPNMANENNDDFGDVSFPQDQVYSQYQALRLYSPCSDGYSGFNEDVFNDNDDILQSDMNFDLSDGDLGLQQELFKQICAQTTNTLDDSDDQLNDDKDHTFQTVIEKGGNGGDTTVSGNDDDDRTALSSDSSDDENSPIDVEYKWKMTKDINNTKKHIDLGPIGSGIVDPWGISNNTNTTDSEGSDNDDRNNDFGNGNSGSGGGGWADFQSANFDLSAFVLPYDKNNSNIIDDTVNLITEPIITTSTKEKMFDKNDSIKADDIEKDLNFESLVIESKTVDIINNSKEIYENTNDLNEAKSNNENEECTTSNDDNLLNISKNKAIGDGSLSNVTNLDISKSVTIEPSNSPLLNKKENTTPVIKTNVEPESDKSNTV